MEQEAFDLYGQDVYEYCNGSGCTTMVHCDEGIYCDECE